LVGRGKEIKSIELSICLALDVSVNDARAFSVLAIGIQNSLDVKTIGRPNAGIMPI